MSFFWAGLVSFQAAAALALALHALAWLHLLTRRQRPVPLPSPLVGEDVPFVTVQLPLYNEAEQVQGLLGAVSGLDWPTERLEIQVLDDSSDDTPERVEAALVGLRARGFTVRHLRRATREGFKAGALANGLAQCHGSLVAIFDADFRPRRDFLRRAVPALGTDLGMVQARWGFRNPDRSIRTRAQALHLDAHFALEQQARSSAGLLMGFNGTAGVWRRRCIEEAGGWQGDTLTEDLDLAYRAQLAGWRLGYLDALSVASELPEELPAIRSQQHRWIRGGAQVARKLLGRLWGSGLPIRVKLQGSAHLLASSLFAPVLVLAVLLPAIPWTVAWGPGWVAAAAGASGVLLRAVLAVLLVGYGMVCVQREAGWRPGLRRLARDFPVYLGLVTALAPWCVRAAWMGWTAPTGTFERTPKGAAQRVGGDQVVADGPVTLWAEVGLAGWSWVGGVAALAMDQVGLGVVLVLQAIALTELVAVTVSPRRAVAAARAAALPQ